MFKNFKQVYLSILGALLLWIAWPTAPFTLIIFVAWVPLLFITDSHISLKRFIPLVLLHMFLWNVLCTWWVAKSTIIGGVSAFIVNSVIMSIPWMIYFVIKKRSSSILSALSLIVLWLSFEYLHMNWDLSWPWLTLGNAFAMQTGWVQWYEYTGVSGGSLWILISNILVFQLISAYKKYGRTQQYWTNFISWLLVLFVPIFISKYIKFNPTILHNKYNVISVQPNVDPYTTKFDSNTQDQQIQNLIQLSEKNIDKNTALVVWPETALPFYIDESDIKNNSSLQPIWQMLQRHPQINLLTGIEGYKSFPEKISPYARQLQGSNEYYESYNSAALLTKDTAYFYHKSKLVPGVEVLPGFLNFMAPVFEKFGGTGGGYAKDTATTVFHTNDNRFIVAPAICYESIYGDYITGFLRKDANLIAIITNDGWWGNTQGHKQHMNYARLRAIESRKWVVRSANTGISCFINPLGNVVQQLGWDKQGALKQDIAAYAHQTFYAKHGDLISLVMKYLSIAVLLYFFYLLFTKKKKNARN